MKQLINPALFSQHFEIEPTKVNRAGFIDPILNVDTKLFVDPLLLEGSSNQKIREVAFSLLKKRFGEVIQLVEASIKTDDVAWRNACKRLDLSERPETCLGYGGAGIGGNSRPERIRQQILLTAKEIINLGEKNPQIISLMGLFEEDVGPDTISDLTTTYILPVLAEITEEFCVANGVVVRPFSKYGNRSLPENPFREGYPVLLVPKDILRDLPLANDWGDVSKVVLEIAEIRDACNNLFGGITQATLSEVKKVLRETVLSSVRVLRELLGAVLNSSTSYDPNDDIFGYYSFRQVLAADLTAFKNQIRPPATKNKEELMRIVVEIVEHFRGLVEDNNMWELLWAGVKPRRERAAQLLFFGIADVFCRANDVDISPEMNAGGGPVDFKFSTGYSRRVLVEVKMSNGRVVHGYEKQLEIYKEASKTDLAVFLIVDVGGLGRKLQDIQAIERARKEAGKPVSRIMLVDAQKKISASKR